MPPSVLSFRLEDQRQLQLYSAAVLCQEADLIAGQFDASKAKPLKTFASQKPPLKRSKRP